jgi:hypothetical protein
LGLVLALSPGKNFSAGANELVRLSFRAASAASGNYEIGFANQPVWSETSDFAAGELPADYISGVITVDPLPALRIMQDGQNVTLAWPFAATNYVLQEADSASAPAAAWKDVTAAPSIIGSDKFVTLPIDQAAKFYRLQRP